MTISSKFQPGQPVQFPVIAVHVDSKMVVLFTSRCAGVVLSCPDNHFKIGYNGSNWSPLGSEMWKIHPADPEDLWANSMYVPEDDLKFPLLAKYLDNCNPDQTNKVVMFTDLNKGMVVSCDDQDKIGYHSEGWISCRDDRWEILPGGTTVILEVE